MNNKNKIFVTLITSNRSGVLSAVMFKGKKMGLMLTKNKTEKLDDARSIMEIEFEGILPCTDAEFIQEIESHPRIHSVEKITNDSAHIQNKQAATASPVLDKSSKEILHHYDSINQESLHFIEEKLTDFLGPVAPLLIKSAVSESHNIGDLFKILATDLNGEDKTKFLSFVDMTSENSSAVTEHTNATNETVSALNDTEKNSSTIENINLASLRAHDLITQESLQIAEHKLSNILGPAAPLLIQAATKKTKHIGDLFLMLSNELEGKERSEFLGLVNGIDLQKL